MEVVQPEQGTVCQPVHAAESVLHPGKKKPTEEELFSEHGIEQSHEEEEGVEPPGTDEKSSILGLVEEPGHAEFRRLGEERKARYPGVADNRTDRERPQWICEYQRDEPPPEAPVGQPGPWVPRRAKPESVSQYSPRQGSGFMPHEQQDQHELPGQSQGHEQDPGRPRDPGSAINRAGNKRIHDPAKQRHGDGRCPPDQDYLRAGILREADSCVRGLAVSGG